MRQTLVLLSVLFAAGLSFASEPAVPTVEAQVWFSPAGGVRDAILESIADAKKEILVGAYKLEDEIVADALVQAKERGVAVSVLMDKKKSRYKKSLRSRLVKGGISVYTDGEHFLYHNKVMIIDRSVVLTGSFNFKADAETSNAENLLRLRSPELTRKYAEDWQKHRGHAVKVKR